MQAHYRFMLAFVLSVSSLYAQAPARIAGPVVNANRVQILHSVSRELQTARDEGPLSGQQILKSITVYFSRTSEQETELQELLADQADRTSPRFHKWLTPEQFGMQFGANSDDIGAIRDWLKSFGFTNVRVARGRGYLIADGSAAEASQAFGASIHHYILANGEQHFANSQPLTIPAAFSNIVKGVTGLDDLNVRPPRPRAHSLSTPEYNYSSILEPHLLTAEDIRTIYDVTDLNSQKISGTGATIVIVGEYYLDANDGSISAYRSLNGLPPLNFVVTSPDYTSQSEQAVPGVEEEAYMDIEIAGGVAQGANIVYDYSSDFENAANDAIDKNLGQILSISYSAGCEIPLATPVFEGSLEQANAEGITILVSTGDTGAAACDSKTATSASGGLAVSYPSSSVYVTAIGGTTFNENESDGTYSGPYWSSTQDLIGGSAVHYIPEDAWNDIGQWLNYDIGQASGGGVSQLFPAPSWQTGLATMRSIPDLAFAASANHDGYLICWPTTCANGFQSASGGVLIEGGTSAAAPLFAGIMALVDQELSPLSPRQGNINSRLYDMAQSSLYDSVFHDVISGNNYVPTSGGGTIGYQAEPGYDLVTGWGSVNAYAFASAMAGVPVISSWTVSPASLVLGSSVTISYSATDSSGAGLSRAELWRAPDAGGAPGTWSEVGSAQTLSGNGPAQVRFTDTPTAAEKYWYGTHLFDSAGNEALEPSPTPAMVSPNQVPTVTIVAVPSQIVQGATVTLTATVQSSAGTPTGTVTFFDSSNALTGAIALNSVGAAPYSTDLLTVGTHLITARYSGDNNFSTASSSAATVTVKAAAPQIAVSPQNGTIGITTFTKTGTGFTPNGPITHTATWPDNSTNVLNGNADSTGSFSYQVTYSGETGTYYQTDTDNTTGQTSNTISWTVSPVVVNDFSLSVSPSAQTLLQSGSVSYNIVTATASGTAQTVSFGLSNLPSGLSAAFSPTSVTTGAQSTLTLTASASAPVGTYTLVVAAASSYTTHTYQISVIVAQAQSGPVMTLTPSIVRFNDQSVGTISSPQTVVLRNSGTGQLIVTGIGLASGSADYALNLSGFSSPLILNEGVPYSLQVYFEPTTAGTRPSEIVIYDNAPGSPQVVSLNGNGLAAQPTTGTISVNATLNGIALPALYFYQYSLTGPTTATGYDNNSFSVTAGTYSIAFASNPSDFTLASVTPSSTQSVVAGGTTTFTLNFTSPDDFYGPTFMQPPGGGFTPQVVPDGSTATYYVDVAALPNNASSPITLSVFGAPEGSTPTFSPQPMYSSTGGTLAIGTTSGVTPPGVYALSLTGTNPNGVTHAGNTSTLAVTTPPRTPVQLVSQSSSGALANSGGTVSSNSMSANGRLVVFSSTSTNLASGATAGNPEVYVRDLQASSTTLVSISNSGAVADSWCYGGNISADGNFVEFSSLADNLYPGSALNTVSGIYVRDLAHGATEREDLAPDGTPSNGNSTLGVISGDGRFVAFISTATNLVSGDSGTQAYLRDRKTGQTVLISSAQDGTPANGSTSSLAISADGRYVAFVSNATNLVSANTGGLYQAYVRDMENGTTSLVSAANSGLPANSSVIDAAGSYPPAISADGRYIAFSSYATNLVPQPTDGISSHNFVYDSQTQQMSLVDVDSVGTPLGGTSYIDAAMSTDGRFIAFYGFDQVLVRDTVQSQTAVVSLAASGQAGNNSTWGWNIGLGGSVVAFASTATNLVANDSNNAADAFVTSNPFVGSVALSSISLGTPAIAGGSTATGTVTLTNVAPAGGATVSVWSNNDAAQPPAVVTVPAGATSAPFSFNTSLVNSETIMTIMAAYNGGSGAAVLSLEPGSVLTVSPTSFDFGYQPVATPSAVESFILTNSGTASLTINSIQMSTGQVFTITANTCQSSIAPGNSCSVSVTFKPTAVGSVSDSIQISTGSPTTVQSITLTGNGAVPSAVLAPGIVNFGNQLMPGSGTATASLANVGNASLSSISVSITGTNSGDFSLSSDGCTGVILPVNSTCLITVAFTPKAQGARTATLSVADSVSGSPQVSTLTGSGVQSTPTILWSPSTTSITYGTPLGSGILDATATSNGNTLAGTFAYSATVRGGAPIAVTSTSILGSGTYILTTTFTPTDTTDYTTITGSVTLTVAKATPTVTVTPSSNSISTTQALSVMVTVAGAPTPTGTVTLSGGGYTSSATTLTSGSATISIPANSLSAGTDTLTATYTPDSSSSSTYNSASGTNSVTVSKTTPTVTVTPSANSITTAQPLTVTVAVNGGTGNPAPTGTVTLSGGGYTSAATPLTNGSTTINIPANSLSAGTDSLAVSYTPDASSSSTYNSTSGSVTVTVTNPAKTTPTVTVTPSANSITTAQPLTVTVAVNGGTGNPTPTGTVTLSSGSYSTPQSLAGGMASFTISAGTLGNGANTLTASYSGDATYTVASSTATVTVEPVSISTTLPSPVNPGSSTTSTVTLTGSGGYSGTMNLSCLLTSSPTGAQSLPTCTLNPASITLASGGSGTSTLTVKTTAASTTALAHPTDQHLWKLGGGGAALAALLLFGIPFRRRRWISMLALLLFVAAAGAIGCGGGGGMSGGSGGGSSTPATTAGNYSFTIAATDSANAQITVSTTISVTVQ
jgi:hypothetical protein